MRRFLRHAFPSRRVGDDALELFVAVAVFGLSWGTFWWWFMLVGFTIGFALNVWQRMMERV